MSFTKQNIKDLLYFADELQAFGKRKRFQFDIGLFAKETKCGTVCCAAGFAGMLPRFRRRGLKTVLDSYDIQRVDEFLGLSFTQSLSLFMPCGYFDGNIYGPKKVTPFMVAKKIRKIVKDSLAADLKGE